MRWHTNGQYIDTSGANSPSSAFKVGARYALDQGFVDSLMDDFRVYKYALSTDQIKHVMNEGAAVRFGD